MFPRRTTTPAPAPETLTEDEYWRLLMRGPAMFAGEWGLDPNRLAFVRWLIATGVFNDG